MEALGIDSKLLVAQAINFAIFYFIFKKYIAQPFSAFIAKERKNESEKQILLEKLRKSEEDRKSEEVKMKKQLAKLTAEETKKARKEAAAVREEIVATAKKEAAEIVEKGRTQVAAERQEMQNEIKKQIGNMSMALVSQGLEEYLTSDMQKEITKRVLTNLETKLHS